MDSISRRNMLAATAAGGLLTAASVAAAQTVEGIPQPQRPGQGGTDPGPRNLMREGQNPDVIGGGRHEHVRVRCRTCAFPSPTRVRGCLRAAGPVR